MADGAARRPFPFLGGPGDGDPDPPQVIPPAVLVDVTPDPVPAAIATNASQYGRNLNIARVGTPDGHLLLPYGDYGANTGPIDVIGYRPSDGHVVTYYDNLQDERIEQYRVLNGGVIWTCTTDPTGRNEAVLAHSSPGGVEPWSKVTAQVPGKGVAVHLFDVAQLSNGDLFVCLARNYTEAELVSQASLPLFNPDPEYNTALAVWRSTDGGTTWSEDFVDLKNGDGYYRPYGMGRIGDTLVLPNSDGGHWLRAPDGTWSTKRTTPVVYASVPPAWSTDGLSFATNGNGNVTFTLELGALKAASPPGGIGTVLAAGPAGWLSLDGGFIIRYGGVTYGTIPSAGFWRGCVLGGVVYLSDGVKIWRCDPAPPPA